MKYVAIKSFVDLVDPSKSVYHDGDAYPRHGYTPTEERIRELSTNANKIGVPLIAIKENRPPMPAPVVEPKPEVAEKPKRNRKKNNSEMV